MNHKRISHEIINRYCRARNKGLTQLVYHTRTNDINGLALAIKARAPRLIVYNECLTGKLIILCE